MFTLEETVPAYKFPSTFSKIKNSPSRLPFQHNCSHEAHEPKCFTWRFRTPTLQRPSTSPGETHRPQVSRRILPLFGGVILQSGFRIRPFRVFRLFRGSKSSSVRYSFQARF